MSVYADHKINVGGGSLGPIYQELEWLISYAAKEYPFVCGVDKSLFVMNKNMRLVAPLPWAGCEDCLQQVSSSHGGIHSPLSMWSAQWAGLIKRFPELNL